MAISAPGDDTRECSGCELHVQIDDWIVLELAGSHYSDLSTRTSSSRGAGIIVIWCEGGMRGPECFGWLCWAGCWAGEMGDGKVS